MMNDGNYEAEGRRSSGTQQPTRCGDYVSQRTGQRRLDGEEGASMPFSPVTLIVLCYAVSFEIPQSHPASSAHFHPHSVIVNPRPLSMPLRTRYVASPSVTSKRQQLQIISRPSVSPIVPCRHMSLDACPTSSSSGSRDLLRHHLLHAHEKTGISANI